MSRSTSGSPPYVGLRIAKTDVVGGPLRDAEPFRKARLARKDTTNPWWVGYRYLPPHAEFPEDADRYREALLAAVRSAWEAYAPVVDEVLRGRPGSG